MTEIGGIFLRSLDKHKVARMEDYSFVRWT